MNIQRVRQILNGESEVTNQSIALSGGNQMLYFVGPRNARVDMLINYLSGTQYTKILHPLSDIVGVSLNDSHVELVRERDIINTKNFIPKVSHIENKNYALCDFSGFFNIEHFDQDESVVLDIVANAIFETSGKTKGIVFSTEYGFLERDLRISIPKLDKLIGGYDEHILSNILLTFVKSPKYIDYHDDVSSDYLKISERLEVMHERVSMAINARYDYDRNSMILKYIEYFISHKEQMHIVDVADNGVSSERILKYIDDLRPMENSSLNITFNHENSQIFWEDIKESIEDCNKEIDWLCEYPLHATEESNRLDAIEDEVLLETEEILKNINSVQENIYRNECEIHALESESDDIYQFIENNRINVDALMKEIDESTEEISRLKSANDLRVVDSRFVKIVGIQQFHLFFGIKYVYPKQRFDIIVDFQVDGIHVREKTLSSNEYEIIFDKLGRQHLVFSYKHPNTRTHQVYELPVLLLSKAKNHPVTQSQIQMLEEKVNHLNIELKNVGDILYEAHSRLESIEYKKHMMMEDNIGLSGELRYLYDSLSDSAIKQEALKIEELHFYKSKQFNASRENLLSDLLNLYDNPWSQACKIAKLNSNLSSMGVDLRYFDSNCQFFGREQSCEIKREYESSNVNQVCHIQPWIKGVEAFDANAVVQQYNFLDTWLNGNNVLDQNGVMAGNANMLGVIANLALVGVLVSAMYSLYQGVQKLWLGHVETEEAHREPRLT